MLRGGLVIYILFSIDFQSCSSCIYVSYKYDAYHIKLVDYYKMLIMYLCEQWIGQIFGEMHSHQSIICIHKHYNCKATTTLPATEILKVHQNKKQRRRDVKFIKNSQNKITIALGQIAFKTPTGLRVRILQEKIGAHTPNRQCFVLITKHMNIKVDPNSCSNRVKTYQISGTHCHPQQQRVAVVQPARGYRKNSNFYSSFSASIHPSSSYLVRCFPPHCHTSVMFICSTPCMQVNLKKQGFE